MNTEVLIVGGGAAGTMAALHLAEAGIRCAILEKNGQIGKKLRITGKGRCNLTNACDLDTLMEQIPRNPKFLYSAFSHWMPTDVMTYFEERLGVPLKTERGNRVFPVSDKAEDVVAALQRALRQANVPVYRETVQELLLEEGSCTGVRTASGKTYRASCVLLTTGGASYPATGSTGDGYALAKQAGHTIVPPEPALVPLETQEPWCKDLMGLSLRNVTLSLYVDKQCRYQALGEMLFTHFGVSGPLVLTASSLLPDADQIKACHLALNLKPGLTPEQLDRRIQRDCTAHPNQAMGTIFRGMLPLKLVPIFLEVAGIPPETKANALRREQRQTLVQKMQAFPLHIIRKRPLKEAIITRGGVSVREVQAKTMASKYCQRLYFAGELLDVDAYTGGFNLQIAFSTAVCAAEAIRKQL